MSDITADTDLPTSTAAPAKPATPWGRIARDGLWDNNVVLAQMLALCPLLAVTGTATNGLGMGLATTAVMVLSGLIVGLSRNFIAEEVRIPVFVLFIATIVTVVDMSLNAWMHALHKQLGLFIPLIVTNCAILGRVESFASRNRVLPSMFDGLMMGLGFTLALTGLGAIREILGSGTLFSNAALLLGHGFDFLDTVLIKNFNGFLLMILPPGGFLMMGFVLAGKRVLDTRRKAKSSLAAAAEATA